MATDFVTMGTDVSRPEPYDEKKSDEDAIATDSKSPTVGKRDIQIEGRKKENGNHGLVAGEAKETKKKGAKGSKTDKNDFSWICSACNEAECISDRDADLLVCEGACQRPFHYPCAGLLRLPPSDEKWLCEDCQNSSHQCGICQEYGADNVNVFLCERQDCGLFFHESCLSMQNVDMKLVERCVELQDNSENEGLLVRAPRFTCPAHKCWTCTEDYIPDEEEEAAKKTKKRRRKQSSSSFVPKRDNNLFRCLHCPIAYHVSCIPPAARFHELALLCHEHASTHKMPDLDIESSLQGEVESQIEKQLAKIVQKKPKVVKSANKNSSTAENPFFPGIRGDLSIESEDLFMFAVEATLPDHGSLVDWPTDFCLPCDIKQEVHSKPPSYRHVHSLRYDPLNKPKPIPPSNVACDCKSKDLTSCDELCLNRMEMMECIGDSSKGNGEKNPYWNCNVGPSCGNRHLNQRKIAKCKPMREKGKGWGLTAIHGIKAGDLVLEYVGEVIDEDTKDSRLESWAQDHPNDPNFYVMQLDTGWYIDAREEANLSRFINHSCDPNCRLTRMKVGDKMRIGIFALGDIAPGEFLSYDYQFDTKHGDKFLCRCGAKNCRGTMKGGKNAGSDEGSELKTKKEEWEAAKTKLERDKKFLEDASRKEEDQANQTGELVPAASNGSETVAAGAQSRHSSTVRANRIFLWRNVAKGDNFLSRWAGKHPGNRQQLDDDSSKPE